MMASGNCKTSRIFENQLLYVSETAEYDLNQSFKNFGLLPAHSYPYCHNTLQVEGGDPVLLLSPSETSPGVLCPALGSSVQEIWSSWSAFSSWRAVKMIKDWSISRIRKG